MPAFPYTEKGPPTCFQGTTRVPPFAVQSLVSSANVPEKSFISIMRFISSAASFFTALWADDVLLFAWYDT